jgi:hypothetical protein
MRRRSCFFFTVFFVFLLGQPAAQPAAQPEQPTPTSGAGPATLAAAPPSTPPAAAAPAAGGGAEQTPVPSNRAGRGAKKVVPASFVEVIDCLVDVLLHYQVSGGQGGGAWMGHAHSSGWIG